MAKSKPRLAPSAEEARAARGAEAQRLVESELFREALEWLKNESMAAFHAAANPAEAWQAKLELDAMDRLSRQLLIYIQSGRDAAEKLRNEQQPKQHGNGAIDIGKEIVDYLMRAKLAREEHEAALSKASEV